MDLPPVDTYIITKEVVVDSKSRTGETGVVLHHGDFYQFEIPEGQSWKDAHIACGPEGWSNWFLNLFSVLKVEPSENYFRLLYQLDSWWHPVPLESHSDVWHIYSGYFPEELKMIANDIPFMYFNNSGQMHVTIKIKRKQPE